MKKHNSVTISGNLVKDIDLRYTQNSLAIGSFTIAYNEGKGYNQQVSFFDCVVFGRIAEVANQYAKKGSQVYIQGTLKQERYTDNQGNNQQKVKIVCDILQWDYERKPDRIQTQQQAQNQTYIPKGDDNLESVQMPSITIDDSEIPF